MFSLNDLIVYPAQGVGRITSIEHKEVGGNSLNFYIVCIIGSNVTLMVPVSNAKAVGLRKLCSTEEALLILESLSDREGFTGYTGQNWNRRQREYTEKLKSGQLNDVSYVLKDIAIIGHGKELSFGERRLLEQATNLLCSEIALVLKKEHSAIKKQVEDLFILEKIATIEASEAILEKDIKKVSEII